MELWFYFALSGAVFAGIPSFLAKVATKRNYSSELFILYGGFVSTVVLIPIAFVVASLDSLVWPLAALAVLSGAGASLGGILKIYALHAIDSTIYFPLTKVLSPALAVAAGFVFFAESFSRAEWLGLLIGIFVPLLLISKVEHTRQSNLVLGLILVLLTAIISVIFSAMSKYAIDVYDSVMWFAALSSGGVVLGSSLVALYRQGGYKKTLAFAKEHTSNGLLLWSSARAILTTISFTSLLLAYSYGGTLAIVHTIHSLYILIPIVLSIIFYQEHCNARKVVAITLSVAALALLG